MTQEHGFRMQVSFIIHLLYRLWDFYVTPLAIGVETVTNYIACVPVLGATHWPVAVSPPAAEMAAGGLNRLQSAPPTVRPVDAAFQRHQIGRVARLDGCCGCAAVACSQVARPWHVARRPLVTRAGNRPLVGACDVRCSPPLPPAQTSNVRPPAARGPHVRTKPPTTLPGAHERKRPRSEHSSPGSPPSTAPEATAETTFPYDGAAAAPAGPFIRLRPRLSCV